MKGKQMTTETETVPQAKAKPAAKAGFLAAFIATLAILALFAWLGGVALNKGFGVHVPFVASWILLAVGLAVVKSAASEVASTWHSTRVKADVTFLAATMAAQEAMQKEHSGGLADFLSKLGSEDTKDTGAYL